MVHALETIAKLHRQREAEQVKSWITDRPPADDYDDPHVWIYSEHSKRAILDKTVWVSNAWSFGNKVPWMPVSRPAVGPPVKPRRETVLACYPGEVKSDTYLSREVFEDDPDPDGCNEVLREMERYCQSSMYADSVTLRKWSNIMKGIKQ